MRTSGGQMLWWSTGFVAFLSFLIFACGFYFALDPHKLAPSGAVGPVYEQQPAAHTQPPLSEQGKLNIVTLGDSLTRGTGDASGLGYVGMVRQALEKETGQNPAVSNLAIVGLQSPGLLQQLKQQQVRQLVASANIIMFTIGGNDLFSQSGGIYAIDPQKLALSEKTLASNFQQVIRELRAINKKATIVYPSLYNPFGDTEAAADSTRAVLDWNSKAAQIAAGYPAVIVVPTYDLFFQKERAYLYTDHFHPNTAGYKRIAERIIQALK